MLDFADMIVLNKFEKRGAEDALRDVRKQWRRNHPEQLEDCRTPTAGIPDHRQPFNDPGVNRLFAGAAPRSMREAARPAAGRRTTAPRRRRAGRIPLARPADSRPRARATWPRSPSRAARRNGTTRARSSAARRAHAHYLSLQALGDAHLPAPLSATRRRTLRDDRRSHDAAPRLQRARSTTSAPQAMAALRAWPARLAGDPVGEVLLQGARHARSAATTTPRSLSHQPVPKIAAPRLEDWGEILRLPAEREPAGRVSVHRRRVSRTGARAKIRPACSPARARPERTNRRFHYLARGQPATRLSTAFDSTTLYGEDPDPRPDIYGQTGNSGVSIATLDDMKKLYSGFDLCAPTTSVSMTINGPAPMILAMFMNTAIDQRVEKYLRDDRRAGTRRSEDRRSSSQAPRSARATAASCPTAHDGSGSALLGVTGDQLVDAEALRAHQARRDAAARARHRAGRHPQGRPGAEHLHLLHRVRAAHDGRRPAVLHRQQGAQFLLGVDLRLSHRRSRREPDHRSSPSRWPTASPSSSTTSRAA